MQTLALLLADARLPVGAHTQSAGLEPALAAGMEVDRVLDLIRARLATITLVEAAAAVLVRRGVDPVAVDTAWRARTPSAAVRENSDHLGRGYLRLVSRLWPTYAAALAPLPRPCRAVVLGIAGAAAELDDSTLARVVGYEDVQTVSAAALKIAPMDPLEATGWLLQVTPDLDLMVEKASGVSDLDDLPAGSAPLLEEWIQRHAQSSARLFRA